MLRRFDVICRNIRLFCWAWEITMLPSLIPVLGCPAARAFLLSAGAVLGCNNIVSPILRGCNHSSLRDIHVTVLIITSYSSSVISHQSSVISRQSSFIMHHHHSFVHSTSLSAVVSSIICHHQSSSIIVSYHPSPSSVVHPSVIHQVFVSHSSFSHSSGIHHHLHHHLCHHHHL